MTIARMKRTRILVLVMKWVALKGFKRNGRSIAVYFEWHIMHFISLYHKDSLNARWKA